jgi:hypothetical protein
MAFVLPDEKWETETELEDRCDYLAGFLSGPLFKISLKLLNGFHGEEVRDFTGYANIGQAVSRFTRYSNFAHR